MGGVNVVFLGSIFSVVLVTRFSKDLGIIVLMLSLSFLIVLSKFSSIKISVGFLFVCI
jgi:hypothetical protein